MNRQRKDTIFKRLSDSSSVCQLRELFLKNKVIVKDPEIYRAFIERIQQMHGGDNGASNTALNLIDDIQEEVLRPWGECERKQMYPPENSGKKQWEFKEYKKEFPDIYLVVNISSGKDIFKIVEKALYLRIAEICDNNKEEMRRCLGVAVRTVRNKCKIYGIKKDETNK